MLTHTYCVQRTMPEQKTDITFYFNEEREEEFDRWASELLFEIELLQCESENIEWLRRHDFL